LNAIYAAAQIESNGAMADSNALVKAEAPYDLVPRSGIQSSMVTTAFTLDGHRVVRSLGIVRGIVVRSRSLLGNLGAAFQILRGGNITLFATLCERARQDAFDILLQHAAALGANAVIGMRYDATEIAGGVTEVLAYGTAVVVEPVSTTLR
jgi:uncharacterized protein YbjQ (UPF0145 family)